MSLVAAFHDRTESPMGFDAVAPAYRVPPCIGALAGCRIATHVRYELLRPSLARLVLRCEVPNALGQGDGFSRATSRAHGERPEPSCFDGLAEGVLDVLGPREVLEPPRHSAAEDDASFGLDVSN